MAKLSRRTFLEATAAGLVATGATTPVEARRSDQSPLAEEPTTVPSTAIGLTVNGVDHHLIVEDRCTLAELLRDRLQLTGTKIGCDRGECGACTVLLDGSPVYGCSYLAVWAAGQSIETVEGLAVGGELHPLQHAFIEHDAPQCGFCTPGQLMSARALLASNPGPSIDDVRAALSGNLCRCSNYNHYVQAVLAAATSMRGDRGGNE